MGPLLLILFTKNLEKVVRKYGLQYQSYVDDIQLYVSFIPDDTTAKVITDKIQECLEGINDWMIEHFWKLNMEKTEILGICPFQHRRCFMKILSVKVNSVTILPKKCAKSLGFYFDNKLFLNKQISEVVKICNYLLENLYRIGSKLTMPLEHQLIQSYVLSNMDYCNATYCGLNSSLVSKLQIVQNKCARFLE